MIIDDCFLHVGSANANERSFRTDNEIGVSVYHKQASKRFRITLWNEYLGSPVNIGRWKPSDFVNQWNRIAGPNKFVTTPAGRKGFVVPFDHNEDKGTRHLTVPDSLTEYVNPHLKDTAFA